MQVRFPQAKLSDGGTELKQLVSKVAKSVESPALDGHRRSRIYGRLDCPAALRAIARGGYVTRSRAGRRLPDLSRLPPGRLRKLEGAARTGIGRMGDSNGLSVWAIATPAARHADVVVWMTAPGCVPRGVVL